MPNPVHFSIVFGGRELRVATLRDAQAAAQKLLKLKYVGHAELSRIAEMIEQAIAGHQRPSAAFSAFAKFAHAKGLMASKENSAAWKDFVKVVGPKRIGLRGEPEVKIERPQSTCYLFGKALSAEAYIRYQTHSGDTT